MVIKPVKVGIIGAGVISYTYLENLINTFSITQVAGISDQIEEKAAERAKQFGVRKMTNEQIYNDPEIEVVVNLTYPTSHFQVTMDALRAGKHVFSEKIMSTNYKDAKEIYDLAKEKGLRFGAAPDTFLGGALQTARKLIDSGYIGQIVMGQAMVARGYRITGATDIPLRFPYFTGGSMPYDLGGYYINALIHLMGPVKRATGFVRRLEEKKMYENPRHPKYKTFWDYPEPSELLASLEFHSGALASLTTVGDCHLPEVPRLEVYGTQGTIICPDPNHFGGSVYLIRGPGKQPYEIPLTHGYIGPLREGGKVVETGDPSEPVKWATSVRGMGVADFAWAIRNNRLHRCSAELALQVVEIITGVMASCKEGKIMEIKSKPEQPAPVPPGYVTGTSVDEACLDT
jgi:predicted dehydrogenase